MMFSYFVEKKGVATPVDLLPLIPPQSTSEKGPDDPSRFYLDALMEFMVTQVTLSLFLSAKRFFCYRFGRHFTAQVMRIEWRDKHLGRPQRCFAFLLDKFRRSYLPHVFPDLSDATDVYQPDLGVSPETSGRLLSTMDRWNPFFSFLLQTSAICGVWGRTTRPATSSSR